MTVVSVVVVILVIGSNCCDWLDTNISQLRVKFQYEPVTAVHGQAGWQQQLLLWLLLLSRCFLSNSSRSGSSPVYLQFPQTGAQWMWHGPIAIAIVVVVALWG